MTLLLITKNYPPAICGVGDHTANLAREFEGIGFKVLIFTETKEASGKKVIISQKPFGNGIETHLQEVVQAKSITHILWQYVPYSYHKKGLPFWWPSVMAAIKTTGVSQFIFFHEVSLRYWTDGLRQTALAFLQRLIARRANHIARDSFTNTNLYRSYFNGRLPQVVPVGSNLPMPENNTQSLAGRIFSFANRIDASIIEAVAAISKTTPVEWVIGGQVGTQLQQQLRALTHQHGLEDQCRITGALPAQQLANELAAATIILLPQPVNKYGQGGVSTKNGTVMAAMRSGKAIISCKGDMTDALFQQRHNILFTPYGSESGYIEALHLLITDNHLAKKLGEQAAKTYQQYCDWQVTSRVISLSFNSWKK